MGQNSRIIVIEDQEDLAALYEASLKKAGYEVINAYTGEEGVAEFQAGGADVIMLDMTLPEMNGVQVLQEIRNLSTSVPVVVVTGETSDETRQQCERLGDNEYLTKPADYKSLLHTIRRSLSEPEEEDYTVVTLRLPSRVVRHLKDIDTNLERAVTILCNCEDEQEQARTASP